MRRIASSAAMGLPVFGRDLASRPAHAVANVEQDFEQQLFALIGGIEIGHAAFVLGGFGALVRFHDRPIEILEYLLAWPHCRQRYRFRAMDAQRKTYPVFRGSHV